MILTDDEVKFGWVLKECIKCGRVFKSHPDYDRDICGKPPKQKVILRRQVERFHAELNEMPVERSAAILKHDKKLYLRYVATYKGVKDGKG